MCPLIEKNYMFQNYYLVENVKKETSCTEKMTSKY